MARKRNVTVRTAGLPQQNISVTPVTGGPPITLYPDQDVNVSPTGRVSANPPAMGVSANPPAITNVQPQGVTARTQGDVNLTGIPALQQAAQQGAPQVPAVPNQQNVLQTALATLQDWAKSTGRNISDLFDRAGNVISNVPTNISNALQNIQQAAPKNQSWTDWLKNLWNKSVTGTKELLWGTEPGVKHYQFPQTQQQRSIREKFATLGPQAIENVQNQLSEPQTTARRNMMAEQFYTDILPGLKQQLGSPLSSEYGARVGEAGARLSRELAAMQEADYLQRLGMQANLGQYQTGIALEPQYGTYGIEGKTGAVPAATKALAEIAPRVAVGAMAGGWPGAAAALGFGGYGGQGGGGGGIAPMGQQASPTQYIGVPQGSKFAPQSQFAPGVPFSPFSPQMAGGIGGLGEQRRTEGPAASERRAPIGLQAANFIAALQKGGA